MSTYLEQNPEARLRSGRARGGGDGGGTSGSAGGRPGSSLSFNPLTELLGDNDDNDGACLSARGVLAGAIISFDRKHPHGLQPCS